MEWYWAVANEIISKEEIGALNSSIGKLNNGEFYNQNADGFYMIPIGKNGVLNKIVLTDGKKGNYSIDSIIEIDCYNETDLTDIRSVVYARERNGIYTENSELFKIYYSKDFRYNDFIAELQNNSQNSNGEQDRARSGREVKFSLKDSDGNALLPEQQEYFKESSTESNDIRFDLKDNDSSKKYFYELTNGQIKKLLADSTKKDNGDIRVGVRKKFTIKDSERRTRYINNINMESYEKHYGNRTIFERLGVKLDNDSGSVVGRELGKELSVDKKQSQNNEGRISNGDANRRRVSGAWGNLTQQEQAQLYQRIGALHYSNYTKYRLRSGNYLLDIENKVIETNGDFDSPSVEGYVEFNKFSSNILIARDCFYDQVNNGRTIRESVEYINEVCQEEVATLHGYDDSQNNRTIGEQGRNNKSNRENS